MPVDSNNTPRTFGEMVATSATVTDKEILEKSAFMHKGEELTASTAIEFWDDSSQTVPTGLEYLIEIDVINEIKDAWSSYRGGQLPTFEEQIRAIVYYIEHDAFLPIGEK